MNSELLAKKVIETARDVEKVYYADGVVYPVFDEYPSLLRCGEAALNMANDNDLLIVPIKRYTSEEDEISGKARCIIKGVKNNI